MLDLVNRALEKVTVHLKGIRFALWWLDLNLLSGPDALQKGRNWNWIFTSFLFNKLKKDAIQQPFFKSITLEAL